jgi:tRNA pseudouridine55 synthase
MKKQKKRIRDDVNGILLLDKPAGISSNSSLQYVKRIYNAKKAGHTGSLDVPATGLLPICFGEATKVCGYLLNANKKYRVRCKLGETTTTGDAKGDILSVKPIPKITKIKLTEIFENFIGNIQQIPPMFSALKHNGERLYKLAYKGIEVERKARNVTIYNIELFNVYSDCFDIEVFCTKGTYIRTLVEDIGKEIGCGAHVLTLLRLESGPFNQLDSISLKKIEYIAEKGQQALYNLLLPMDAALKDIPKIRLADEEVYCLSLGQSVTTSGLAKSGQLRIYNSSQQFIGLGEATEDGKIYPKRLINIG